MPTWEFPGSEPIAAHVSTSAGSVRVTAAQTDATRVSITASESAWFGALTEWALRSALGGTEVDTENYLSEVRVSFDRGRLEIVAPKKSTGALFRRTPSLDIEIAMPPGSDCTVTSASADLTCTGELSGLTVKSASGDIDAERVTGRVSAQTASGDVSIRHAGGDCRFTTASGDIRLDRAEGDAAINSVSGDVRLREAEQSVEVKSVSGDLWIDRAVRGRANVNTTSGDVHLGVASGVGVYLDLSSMTGDISSELDESDGEAGEVALHITCRTMSGDINITRSA